MNEDRKWAVVLGLFLVLINQLQARIGVEYQMQLGNPSNATTDTNNYQHYLIQRTVQALDYNASLGLPNWASWSLTASDIGTNARSSFITDTNLPANFYRVTSGDYTGSGYDRGHLCPSKDRTDTPENNDLVFFMSNILPQHPLNNSGIWNQFETYCRDLVLSSNQYELLITCGPSGFSGARINTNGPVFIPDFVWKMVVVLPPGDEPATNRISATNRVIAIKVPNNATATNSWTAYVSSANQIQVDTGLTFFTALPADVAASLRTKVDGQTNPPPSLLDFTPTIAEIGSQVILTGTNFTNISTVAFNGTPAVFTVDSATQITAIVPTNATSGFISVTTASGTAISANTFTVLVNGGIVYSGILAGWDVSGSTNYGISPLTPTTNVAGISVTGLTRGSGVKTTGTAAANAWGGVGFTNVTVLGAVAGNQYASFSLTASNGYRVSFTRISRYDYYRSSTGPTNGVLQFQIGANPFIDITNLNYSTASSGSSVGAIDLSTIPELQNVGAGTSVTFRIVNYGGGSSGTWYVYNTLGTTLPDLVVEGTVTQLVTNTPALPPTFTSVGFTNQAFHLTLEGSMGTNYVIATATNLSAPVWLPLVTNAASFQFILPNGNSVPQRFFRAYVLP